VREEIAAGQSTASLRQYGGLERVPDQHHHEPDCPLGVRVTNVPSPIAQQSLE
jgi:hypothetical protein